MDRIVRPIKQTYWNQIFSIIKSKDPSSRELYSSRWRWVPIGTDDWDKFSKWFAKETNPSVLASIETLPFISETLIVKLPSQLSATPVSGE